ncbi:hypothetical protein B0H21DRAFT_819687 [Amylocystis lapponica]|nr:hypothetical protein B0H21DRAFT_819687 [Amylocystis lapponica]
MAGALLKLAIPLVDSYGFTRDALSRSVLALPTPHPEPLSDTAVSALFGSGDDARRTLLGAWLRDARAGMRAAPSPRTQDVLRTRLARNERVLRYLPEVRIRAARLSLFRRAVGGSRARLRHVAEVADEACHLTGDTSVGPAWYARRASLAAIYAAAELHQLASPSTAYDFLDSLLGTSSSLEASLGEADLFASYIGRSWAGIIKSRGVF